MAGVRPVTEAVLALEVVNLALAVKVRIHGKHPREGAVICDTAKRGAICRALEQMLKGGFNKVNKLLVCGMLCPTPLKVSHTFG
jgi:hypothetical protein